MSDVPRGGVQVLFGHQKERRPPPWIQPTLRAYMFGDQPAYPTNTKEWVIMGLFLARVVILLGEHVKQGQ